MAYANQLINYLSKIKLGNLFKALICSSLNLVILAIIILFITKFSQGFVIPLDLYMKTNPSAFVFNIVTFHFLLSFLALIMTLYPTYIFAFLFERGKAKSYNSKNFGLIYYKYSEPNSDEDPELSKTESYIRKISGLVLFMIWIGLIAYVYNKHQIDPANSYLLYGLSVSLSILLLTFFVHLQKIKKGDNKQKLDWWANFANISFKWYIPYFILANAILCFIAWTFEWNLVTVIFQLVICFLLGAHLVIVRTFRKKIEWIENIVSYLGMHRVLGIVTLLFIIAININSSLAEKTNAINIILASLIAFYTIITLIFKMYLFLKYRNTDGNKNYIPLSFFKLKIKGYRTLLLITFFYFLWNSNRPNNLHQLSLLPKEKIEQKTIEEFCKDFQSSRDIDKDAIYYAAYGGGLKAHYWNFQILEYLDAQKAFNNIVAMSGVSGGGMGIGNFTAVKYLDYNTQEAQTLISKIKSSNILGIELSWLLGYDFLRYMLPFKSGIGKGRSHRSTNFYTENLKATELNNSITFTEVYNKLSQNKHYPNIIINSTATTDKYGIVSAINHQNIFPASLNLIDVGDKTLNYFEAITTCNRFPVISPAAYIPSKGYFLDGGYFENSGIMSLSSFQRSIEKAEQEIMELDSNYISFSNQPSKLVTVSNTKLNYLQFLLRKSGLDYTQICDQQLQNASNQTEISAIFNGAIQLDRMPNYIRARADNNQHLIDIALPYYIHISNNQWGKNDDLEELFGGNLKKEIRLIIESIVRESNDLIIKTLQTNAPEYKIESWGIIDPPTARILSRPVEIYMKAMMHHPYVKEQLESVIN